MNHYPPHTPGRLTAPGRVFINDLCIQCGLCLENCPAQAICVAGTRFMVGEACTACAACLELCPAGAVKLKEDAMDNIKRVVMVTGGSRGIGRAIALKMADPETAVIFTHVDPASKGAAETLALLKEKAGAAEAQCWDVEDSAAVQKNIEETAARYGRLDILVNNAGLNRDALSIRMSDDDWHKVLQANLFGVFACSRAAAKIMMKQRHGRIINLSSIVAFTGNVGQANYTASKAGLLGLTRTMALELAGRGVTVNAVAPGFIDTDMTARLDDKIRQTFIARVPLGRFGTAEDVAESVAFLAGPGAAYITGQTLHVNGGLYF